MGIHIPVAVTLINVLLQLAIVFVVADEYLFKIGKISV